MQGRGRKTIRKERNSSVSISSGERKRLKRERKPAKSVESVSTKPGATPAQEKIAPHDLVSGKPSLQQSTYGTIGNFELVVPLAEGGLAYYWRNNDDESLPWEGPVKFGAEAGRLDGVSLIQGDFGPAGNLELVATDLGGHHLMHFWRDSGSALGWYGPTQISEKSLVPVFSGSPAMIWSNFGCRGNFDLVVPRTEGGFSYYWRDNDDPALSWCGPLNFATEAGIFDAVSFIQSNFGDPGNLELVARSGDSLLFFWGEPGLEMKWHGPEVIATGVSGAPSMIQSTFGNKGNFELVVPLASGGLGYYWRDNDDAHLHWYGPFMFGMNTGQVEGVSLIQSNFGNPGHLELVAQIDGCLAFFWRDSGPDLRWNGPQYLTM
jgi:hypothetical protein